MKHTLRILALALMTIGMGLIGCGPSEPASSAKFETVADGACTKHNVSRCPFCSPELLETMGFCKGHGVPEAVCTKCRDDLEAAFRSENDWCGGHGLPESHCELCNPGVLDKWKGTGSKEVATQSASEACAKHKVANCPFCFPAVIDQMGFCGGHGVPEALCTKCRDDLEAAFRSENDWCGGHGLPESHCELCNPGVLDKWKEMGSEEVATQEASEACAKHKVANCPFCFPAVIDQMGFCGGHGVPEALCTKCRDDLEDAFRSENDWCGGHGLPESHCELCNPGVLDKWKDKGNEELATQEASEACAKHQVSYCPFCFPVVIDQMGFCGGHGVPEALCTKCRDDLEQAFRSENDWCGGHGLPESHCELCNPGTLDRYKTSGADAAGQAGPEAFSGTPRVLTFPSLKCSTGSSVIALSSASVAETAGLILEQVQRGKLRKTLEAPATIEYDSRAFANLAPRAAGTVVEVRRDLGDQVEAGDVLLILDSADLGVAKAELLRAAAHVSLWTKNSQREQTLLMKGLSTDKDMLEAETKLVESEIALATAEQRLRNFGLNAQQIETTKTESDTSSLLSLSAPFSGVVVGLDAVLGELASPGASAISIADTSRMWAMIDVDQTEIRFIQTGQPVLLSVEGWPGETLGGQVTWVSSDVDKRTRTVKVRAEFSNQEGILRAHSFATAKIVTRDESDAVLLPKAAVQWEGCCNVAFERKSPTEYQPRKLRLGYQVDGYYEVLSGLSGGESVVTQGSFLLKTELRKGSIGAGCCEVDHLGE
ncbi:MAG: efflux RND transporter periplasmic adaptor subunit [bacterium]|nr:efflux RND transporter periplasmic adaptor subunit [bacterium]